MQEAKENTTAKKPKKLNHSWAETCQIIIHKHLGATSQELRNKCPQSKH